MLLVHNNWLIIHVQQANKQTNKQAENNTCQLFAIKLWSHCQYFV